MIDLASLPLLKGKKALVTGIANDQSIAWGCAKAFRLLGADLAITYLNEKAKPYVEPLAQSLDASILMPLDLRVDGQLEAVFEKLQRDWGILDLRAAFDRLRSERGPSGPRRRLLEGRLPARHGSVVLVIHPDGQACGAADERAAARCSR